MAHDFTGRWRRWRTPLHCQLDARDLLAVRGMPHRRSACGRAMRGTLRMRSMSLAVRATGVMAAVIWSAAALAESSSSATTGMAVTVTKVSRSCFNDVLQVSGVLVPREEVFVRPEN